MTGNLNRRGSQAMRRTSIKRRGSTIGGPLIPQPSHEIPWDLFDRLLLPLLCCHGAATILAFFLNLVRLSQVSSFVLFGWFALSTTGAVLFYHNLKVSASGKAVLVTGCESPLVWCLAKKLDDIGFTVFAGFSKKHDNEDADLLKDEGTGRMKILQLDVTSETQILEASLYVTEHLPDGADGLWAIVHGETMVALGEIEWIPFSVLRKSIDINLLGAARLTQIMLPLIRRAGGRVVFLSSALAKIPAPIRGAQCATQAGIEGLAICLRQELRPRGVDVSVIATGEFSAGNAWLDDSSLLDQAKFMWSSLSDEQRRSYGEDHFETAIRSLEKYTRAEPDFRPALKCLADSIIRTFPLPRYTPITAAEKLQTFIAEHLPPSVYETIYLK